MLAPCTPTPAAVLETAGSTVVALQQRLWVGVCDEDLVDAVQALEVLTAQAAAVRAQLLTEVDVRQIPRKSLSWTSTHDWYAHLAGTTIAEAHRTLRHARALTSDRTATMQALADGEISQAQAGIISDAIDELPTSPTLRDEGEHALLAEAGRLNATELRKTARRLVEVIDPDADERKAEAALDREERAAHLQRNLSLTEDGAGGIRIRGRGTIEDAAVIRAALIPLTKPAPAIDPERPEDGAESDPRDHGARMWDALVEVARHALDTDLPPASHGTRPRVGILIDLESLRTQTGQAATTDDGLRLSIAAVRRLACDADILPICLGTQGHVLDVGRTHRLVTMALWLALIARDRHCVFPGCTRPPVMCHAHHITHWADGGHTALHNLVLLCGAHHRVLHHTPGKSASHPPTDDQSSDPHPDDETTHHQTNGSATAPDASRGVRPDRRPPRPRTPRCW